MGVSLDHWLNANTSLAVGSLNGVAPQLDSSGLGYLSLPLMSAPSLITASDPSGVPSTAALPYTQANWIDDQDVSFQGQFGGIGGSAVGMDQNVGGGMGEGEAVGESGENNDEYWNVLIDGASGDFWEGLADMVVGILGTTGGLGAGAGVAA